MATNTEEVVEMVTHFFRMDGYRVTKQVLENGCGIKKKERTNKYLEQSNGQYREKNEYDNIARRKHSTKPTSLLHFNTEKEGKTYKTEITFSVISLPKMN